jgi:hypothetical protein
MHTKFLIGILSFAAGLGMGAMLMLKAGVFQTIPIINHPIEYNPPAQCPPYIPSTPLTQEELEGLARARDLNTTKTAQVEATLRQEILDLKRMLGVTY